MAKRTLQTGGRRAVTRVVCPAGHVTARAEGCETWCQGCGRYIGVAADGVVYYAETRLPEGAPVPYRRGPR